MSRRTWSSPNCCASRWRRSTTGFPATRGIGAHTLSGPEQLVRQIQLARELGAEGFVLFSLTEKLAVRFLPPLRLGVTSRAPEPECAS